MLKDAFAFMSRILPLPSMFVNRFWPFEKILNIYAEIIKIDVKNC